MFTSDEDAHKVLAQSRNKSEIHHPIYVLLGKSCCLLILFILLLSFIAVARGCPGWHHLFDNLVDSGDGQKRGEGCVMYRQVGDIGVDDGIGQQDNSIPIAASLG